MHLPIRSGLLALLCVNPFLTGFALPPSNPASDLPISVYSGQTTTGLERGRQHYRAGQFSEALELWEGAAREYQNRGEPIERALSLSSIALAAHKLGRWERARESIEQSLSLLQAQPGLDDRGLVILAQALHTQGVLQQALGQPEAALETWERAEATYAEAGDEVGVSGSQIDRAQVWQTLGSYRRAATLLERTNERLQEQPDDGLKAAGLRSLGVALQVLGRLEESQSALGQSLAIARQLNDPDAIAATLFQLGNTARALPEGTDAAIAYYQQAAATAVSPLTQLQAQLNHLNLRLKTQEGDDFSSLLSAIESNLDRLPPSRGGIYARVNFAELSMTASAQNPTDLDTQLPATNTPRNNDRIARHLATAIAIAKDLNDPKAESYALGYLGQLYESNQQWQTARNLTEQAIILSEAANASEIAYRWQWQLGRILKQDSDISGAIVAYKEAVKTLGSLRSDLVRDPEAQVSFRERVEPVYRELVDLLLRSNPSQANLKDARQVLESLQLAELDNFLREACLDAQPQQIDRIDPTAAVVYPIILPDRLAVVLSLPDGTLRHYQTPLPSEDVERLIGEMRQSLNPAFPNQLRLQLSQQLYDWLLRPIEADLGTHAIETLVFIPDGGFRNIPIAALHDGERYTIEKYGVAISPGLQLLEPKSLDLDRLAILTGGLTEARQGFSALPAVAFEISQIAAKATAQVFLDRDFTRLTLKDRIDIIGFPIIHLATHGQFSSNPEDTFILTWEDKIGVKEFTDLLTVREQNRATPIELLVLSACQTALGDRRAALGLAGLAVRSGARSTLATLWNVNDESTAVLMVKFYQQLIEGPGINKAKALRQAQISLLQDPTYKHPYFWAPFILVGNWL
ncbi:CHAT domain-containing protein [Oscillatoriales cyanobacterium LEGE 11467]|uniref:CHAT domain-containing protein n=1 Tax=Zarconia navalis LEGE 11467 TaxID=1828826 RepID=A0A928VXA0_9CYAN|nr:CHAT domain-containing protein [Zarconia navalis]MBE9039961.1 CHAT domain-containing protein [Zarconia navalis LEGE 11467]